MDPNKAERVREEVEEKIRGKRKPAWGRLAEGGRVANTRERQRRRRRRELPPDGKLGSVANGWRGNSSLGEGNPIAACHHPHHEGFK